MGRGEPSSKMQNRELSVTIVFMLLGMFIMRVVPRWIDLRIGWLNFALRWLCYIVGGFITIFFACSLIYNYPLSWNNLLY